jgi:hypothetical protein
VLGRHDEADDLRAPGAQPQPRAVGDIAQFVGHAPHESLGVGLQVGGVRERPRHRGDGRPVTPAMVLSVGLPAWGSGGTVAPSGPVSFTFAPPLPRALPIRSCKAPRKHLTPKSL